MFFRTFSTTLWLLFFTCLTNEIEARVVSHSHKGMSRSSASLARRGKSHLDFAAERKGLQQKYREKETRRSHDARQNIIQENMVNQNMDVMYHASVEVGTPPRSYAVILGKYTCLQTQ
jgi:hypothetical protein